MTAPFGAAALAFEGVRFAYGDTLAADDVDLSVRPGELVTLVGPSGCGKSTLLKLVAGLLQPSGGRLLMDGRDLRHTPPEKRRLGWVPQSYALFEHLSVARNVAFGLRMQGVSKREQARRVGEVLELCQIQDLATRPVTALSGGQQQRVAVARALAVRPRVLLLDEPLAALDPQLRLELRAGLARLLRESGVTTLFVTHDQGEALALADRVAVLRQGKLEQFDTPEVLWQEPASAFVASFFGHAAVLPTRRISPREVELLPGLYVRRCGEDAPHVVLRPEDLVLSSDGTTLQVVAVEYAGGRFQVTGEHSSGVTLRFFSTTHPKLGGRICVGLREGDVAVIGEGRG